MAARVLVIGESASLAHVGRSIAFAARLPAHEFRCSYASGSAFARFYEKLAGSFHPLSSALDPASFNATLARGAPVYDQATLSTQVQEDLSLFERLSPDVVVGDFRLSLSISARVARIPYVNVCNAHWSPWRDLPYPLAPLRMTRLLARSFGLRVTRRIFDYALPGALAAHARPFNAVGRKYGLAGVPDIRWIYTDGDVVAYADLPSVAPVRDAPASHIFIGPLPWSPDLPLPEWWARVPKNKPVAYVTMGSTGDSELMPVLVRNLSAQGYTTVVATAERARVPTDVPDCFVSAYVPGPAACSIARFVVCNGGSATAYQAMQARRPVLGLPVNLDQALTMDGIARCGAGVFSEPAKRNAIAIGRSVEAIIESADSMSETCRSLMENMPSVTPASCARRALEPMQTDVDRSVRGE